MGNRRCSRPGYFRYCGSRARCRSIFVSIFRGARVWPALTAITGADALADLAEVVGGYRITDLGTTDWADDIPARYRKLQEIASPAQFGDLSAPALIKWYFALPGDRTISPGLTLPLCNYIGELMKAGRGAEIESAFPAHALFCGASK